MGRHNYEPEIIRLAILLRSDPGSVNMNPTLAGIAATEPPVLPLSEQQAQTQSTEEITKPKPPVAPVSKQQAPTQSTKEITKPKTPVGPISKHRVQSESENKSTESHTQTKLLSTPLRRTLRNSPHQDASNLQEQIQTQPTEESTDVLSPRAPISRPDNARRSTVQKETPLDEAVVVSHEVFLKETTREGEAVAITHTASPKEYGQKSAYPWLTIELFNERNKRILGRFDLLTEHIRSSSDLVARCYRRGISEIQISGVQKETILRYIDCISPAQKPRLPEYDFSLDAYQRATITHEPVIKLFPVVSPIKWTASTTVDLYVLAALHLHDSYVCNLVIDYWKYLFGCGQNPDGTEIEVEKADIIRLFTDTETGDPAREQWLEPLHFTGFLEPLLLEADLPKELVEIGRMILNSDPPTTNPWVDYASTWVHADPRSHAEYVAIATRLLHAAQRERPHTIDLPYAHSNGPVSHKEKIQNVAILFRNSHQVQVSGDRPLDTYWTSVEGEYEFLRH